ncbi:MAG: hypothetical protein JW816_04340 [Candidatus Buchananbacteria bacterium]|nr:hypothetical protein [Candidatus Buchananbacteria bacterium]
MATQVSENLKVKVVGKYIFLDNDFLNALFDDEDLFKLSIKLFPVNHMMIEPFVRIEFLRDTFRPEQYNLKADFIQKKVFCEATNHQEIFLGLQDNMLVLSKIYRHQKQAKRISDKCGPSIVDLVLAARLVYYSDSSVLITGNKKDFPARIFDCVGSIVCEDELGVTKVFYVLELNIKKFTECHEQLSRIEI